MSQHLFAYCPKSVKIFPFFRMIHPEEISVGPMSDELETSVIDNRKRIMFIMRVIRGSPAATIYTPLFTLKRVTHVVGESRQIHGKTSWLKPLIILWGLMNAVAADQFGNFTYTDNGTSITITDYPTSAVGPVEIPSTIVGKPVTSIGSGAFLSCSSLTSVTMPSSVTSIGFRAFDSCSGLTSISIPDGVTSIGNYAFFDCHSLLSVTIPAGVSNIGGFTFFDCSGLTSVTISNGITSIGSNAFNSCTGLTSVTIPGSVTHIADNAFYCCTGLTSLTVPGSVISIDSEVTIVRASVSLTDRSSSSGSGILRYFFRFSRIRS